jgi:hypothetical protein
MMKKVFQISIVLLFGLTACNTKSEKEKEPDLESEKTTAVFAANDANCVPPPSWFTGNVPEPNPEAFPPIDDVTNCDFHLISWQYFLWLTEEVDGKLRFETMYTENAIRPETKDQKSESLDIVTQALSKGVLIDQNGRAVYSNILINEIYRDWVLDNYLYINDTLENFDPNASFPVGAMSLKPTWKIVAEGEDVSNLYTKSADIELFELINGAPAIPDSDPNTKNVEVALVGLHIAVVVEGHPEFIWASFEYDKNAPDFKMHQGMNEAVSEEDWLFYKAGTTARKTNATNAQILEFVDQSKQTISPITQVARQYKNGGGSETNQNNIENLNESVKAKLTSTVWHNYFEVGAVWFSKDNGLNPDWAPQIDTDSIVTGSTQLSNSVIETFTQKVSSMNQCFSCHNTMPVTSVPEGVKVLPGKNANTSHILLKNYQGGGEVKR